MEELVHVMVYPDSKKKYIEQDGKRIRIYVTAPAQAGKANEAAKELLAEYLKIPQKQVVLIKGSTSPTKTFKVYKKIAQQKIR